MQATMVRPLRFSVLAGTQGTDVYTFSLLFKDSEQAKKELFMQKKRVLLNKGP